MIITLIFISSLFTALGFFDKLVNFCRCGLIIPITGFAHSMTSAAIEFKRVLYVPTGALFSPITIFQKNNILSIAHAISLEAVI